MKIFCVGRNYGEHARELGNAIPENPVIFMKPDTALIRNNEPFYLPDFSKDVHHELELVLRISKSGKKIQEKFASLYYNEIGLGIDFTARDLQNNLKAKGLPWELAKGFDGSAPLGGFVSIADLNPGSIDFKLEKNGQMVQSGNSSQLIFSFDQLVAFISNYYTLKVGDLIFTGTPAGVGPVAIGDELKGYMNDTCLITCKIL